MILEHFNVLLADDDNDDCNFFKQALNESPLFTNLTIVHDGEQLMRLLSTKPLPHVLFLDLNMPRKSGFECLIEIKLNEKLRQLPVIIFSTSFQQDIVNLFYKQGAQYCIRKPSEFSELQRVIHRALTLVSQEMSARPTENISQPTRENFVLTG
jgi:CheY-like chemotaxis protein